MPRIVARDRWGVYSVPRPAQYCIAGFDQLPERPLSGNQLRALPASTIPAKWEPRPPLYIGQPDIQLIEAGMRPPQRSAKSHCSYTRRDAHTSCSAEHSPPIAIAHTCKALQPIGSPHLVYRRDPRVLQLMLADHCRARGESMQSQKRYTTRLQIQCV